MDSETLMFRRLNRALSALFSQIRSGKIETGTGHLDFGTWGVRFRDLEHWIFEPGTFDLNRYFSRFSRDLRKYELGFQPLNLCFENLYFDF